MTARLIDQLRASLGAMRASTDPRIDRPLPEQFDKVVEFATSREMRPRRSVPVRWDDTDIAICEVLCKLVDEIERLHQRDKQWATEVGKALYGEDAWSPYIADGMSDLLPLIQPLELPPCDPEIGAA